MRKLTMATLAFGLVLAGNGLASADDIVRLGGPGAKNEIEGGTDTALIRGYGHGGYGHGGHYHGGHYGGGYYGGGRYYGGGGYYGGYGRSYYGGYFGGYGRSYGGYYGGYYSRPYYYGSYYYQPTYYYSQPYCSSSYYYPIAGDSAPVTTLQGNGTYQAQSSYTPSAPPLQGNGTFPYDGGPRSTVPLPAPAPGVTPSKNPASAVPLEGRLVKLPTQASGGVSVIATPEIQRLRFVITPTATPAPAPVGYPAYGEGPSVPTPRKTATR